ncbi:MAG: tectonin domain-containing protein, partial [Oceanococcus sp.]
FGSYFEDDGGKFMAAVSRYISSPGLARQQFEDSKANLADAERALVGLQRQAANAAQLQAELRKRTATNDSRGVKNVSSKTIQWTPFDNPHRLNQISSGPDALYGRNATNQTWKYDYVKRAWTRLGGAASIVLSVAPDGKVWRLDTNKDGSNNNHIYFLNTTANKWERIAGGKLRLSAGPNVLWGSNTQGAIWRYQNSNWNKIPGAASDVSVDEQGVAWHLSQRKNSGGGYDLYKSKNDRAWDKIGSPPGGWTRISGGPNGLWAINPIGEVWLYRRGTKSYWEKMANKETAVYINAAAKGDVWIISAQGQISHWNL